MRRCVILHRMSRNEDKNTIISPVPTFSPDCKRKAQEISRSKRSNAEAWHGWIAAVTRRIQISCNSRSRQYALRNSSPNRRNHGLRSICRSTGICRKTNWRRRRRRRWLQWQWWLFQRLTLQLMHCRIFWHLADPTPRCCLPPLHSAQPHTVTIRLQQSFFLYSASYT